MLCFNLEFEDEKQLTEAVDKLWKRHGITGEIGVKRLDNGRWLLSVSSEKKLRQSTLESLKGRFVELD